MALGRRLAEAGLGMLGMCLSSAAGAVVVMAVTSPTVTLASARPWVVSVGTASRTLYPGVEATMPYEIKNDGTQTRMLHATTVEFKNDGVGMWDDNTHRYLDECRASWFRAGGNSIPTEVEVAPNASISGAVNISFDQAPVSQDACRNITFDVTVTAD